MLRQIIYVSAAIVPFSDRELAVLLEQSRVRNAATGLTGMLVYDQGSFLQVLEGSPAGIADLLARIERDRRHHRFSIRSDSPIAERQFGDWAMGFTNVGTLPTFPDGYLGDLQSTVADLSIDASRAKRALMLFQAGSLRQAWRP